MDRPTLQSSSPRSWRSFLWSEWALLLLAAVLTVILWWIVRGNVVDERDPVRNIEVVLRVEERHRNRLAAVFTGDSSKVAITLKCSKREQEEVEAQLKKDGWRVEMLVRSVPTGNSRKLNKDLDRYQWKFADERILHLVQPEVPEGTVFRLEPRKATIATPATTPPAAELSAKGVRAEIVVKPPLVDVALPVDAPDEPLIPDPIDLARLLERNDVKFDVPFALPLTFHTWRALDTQQVPRAYRAKVALPSVEAQIVLRAVGERTITNELLVLLPSKKYDYEPDSLQSVEEVRLVPGLSFRGHLTGTKADLDKLEEDAREKRGNWFWAVRIKEPDQLPPRPEEGQDPEKKTLSAEIVPVLLGPFRGLDVRFVPTGNQDAVDIEVSWHAKQHK